MKNILFYGAITLYFLSGAQAAENPSIPCYIINKTFNFKTLLTGIAVYSDQPDKEKEISLVIEGVTENSPCIQQHIDLSFGIINRIHLALQKYHEERVYDLEETLIANLVFDPSGLLKEVTFTMDYLTLVPEPIYVEQK